MIFKDKYVGSPVEIGKSAKRYDGFLMDGEVVHMEFKGLRDALLFTNLRLVLIDRQGLTGRKVELWSIPWKSITAFSVENSGTFDLDAELKVYGSGFESASLSFNKGTDVRRVNAYLCAMVLR